MLNVLSGGVTDHVIETEDIIQKTLTLDQMTLQAGEYSNEIIVDLSEVLDGEVQILSTQFASTGNSYLNICTNTFTSSTKTFRWSARNLSNAPITFTPTILIVAKKLGGGVTLKRLLSKIKHFFHREEVLA